MVSDDSKKGNDDEDMNQGSSGSSQLTANSAMVAWCSTMKRRCGSRSEES
jgi:hypothetical protein